MNPEITIVEYQTAPHLRMVVDCSPHGMRNLLCETNGQDADDIRAVLAQLVPKWAGYWQKVLETTKEQFRRYETDDFFTGTDFHLVLCQSGGWVDDDFFFEVRFDEDGGWWAVFFKDGEVIHAQFAG